MTYSMNETSSQRHNRAAVMGATAQPNSRVATLAARLEPSPLGWQSVAVYVALSVFAIATYAEFLHCVIAAP